MMFKRRFSGGIRGTMYQPVSPIAIILAIFLIPSVSTEAKNCYDYCVCDGNSVHCIYARFLSSYGFENMIKELPASTIILSFSYTSMKVLPVKSFKRLTQLRELHLSNNRIIEFPKELTKTYFPSLKVLDLSSNRISELHIQSYNNMASITTLMLNNNQMKIIAKNSFDAFPNLEELNLSDNELRDLPSFQALTNLEIVKFDFNSLTQLPRDGFKGLTNLYVLNVSSNEISIIEDGALKHFKNDELEISLYNNMLTSIGPGLFKEKKSFKSINFAYNIIREVKENTFKGVTVSDQTNGINLQLNKLQSLDFKSVHGMTPGTILLQGNKFTCSCDLYKLIDATSKIKVSLVGYCAMPYISVRYELNITNKYEICGQCEMLNNKTKCLSSTFVNNNPLECLQCTCVSRAYVNGSCLHTDNSVRTCNCTSYLSDTLRYDHKVPVKKSLASWVIAILVIGLIVAFVLISLPIHIYCKRRLKGKDISQRVLFRKKRSSFDMSSDNNQESLSDGQPGPSGVGRTKEYQHAPNSRGRFESDSSTNNDEDVSIAVVDVLPKRDKCHSSADDD